MLEHHFHSLLTFSQSLLAPAGTDDPRRFRRMQAIGTKRAPTVGANGDRFSFVCYTSHRLMAELTDLTQKMLNLGRGGTCWDRREAREAHPAARRPR